MRGFLSKLYRPEVRSLLIVSLVGKFCLFRSSSLLVVENERKTIDRLHPGEDLSQGRPAEQPYFWKELTQMRKPYHVQGKDLIIIPKTARVKFCSFPITW